MDAVSVELVGLHIEATSGEPLVLLRERQWAVSRDQLARLWVEWRVLLQERLPKLDPLGRLVRELSAMSLVRRKTREKRRSDK